MLMGTDPEFFLSDGEGGFKSASEIFEGKEKKWTPSRIFNKDLHKWEYMGGGHQAFRDGFAVELNVLPSSCRETLTGHVQNIMRDVETFVRKTHPKWSLVSKAAIPVDLEYINTLPEDVRMFGCDPAFSAWTEREERIELNGSVHPWRYAGGHMHFSISNSKAEIFQLIRLFDLFIGLPLSLIFNEEDEFERRKYYGRAGEFRFQNWGLEYRVPSCRVWNHPMIASMALGVGRLILLQNPSSFLSLFEKLSKERKTFEEDLIKAINEGKGGEDLIQEVSYYYNKKTIDYLKGEGKKAFELSNLTLLKVPCNEGWNTSLVRKGIYTQDIRSVAL